jgi:glyoxylase-like metal-dependent hydrolase (beta-lactamase superfamily II)
VENDLSEVAEGIWRATFALPLGIDHVHCYLLRSGTDGWTIVDTGLGLPDAEDRWRAVLDRLGGRVDRIVVTHFHPDHVGAAAPLAKLTGAGVHQGEVDYAQCLRAWGPGRSQERFYEYMRRHGMPEDHAGSMSSEGVRLAGWVKYAHDPEPLVPGEHVDGWEILLLPGHADGHLALLRDGVLIAGDALLATISPNVGLYHDAHPDPLGDYLDSLARIEELAPRVAFAGHGPAIDDPRARARELIAHHRERLDATVSALDGRPQTAYDVSLVLFPEPLPRGLRRFALAETRAHLEYLALRDRARRLADGDVTAYAALQ